MCEEGEGFGGIEEFYLVQIGLIFRAAMSEYRACERWWLKARLLLLFPNPRPCL